MALGTTTRTTSRTKARSGCSTCGAPAKGKCTCDDACVPCGCGELACLCRPNWFAGMVLRDEDLRRLDQYITGRFRRLNLEAFGPGVLNGLEVRCDPCGSGVVVGCGHAISPCGDDIVVCDDAHVDICKLIDACRKPERDPCLPHQRPRACPDIEEQWILAIEYSERPEKGVLPLRFDGGSKSCDCGGHGGGDCGCGCGGHGGSKSEGGWSAGNSSSGQYLRPRNAPASCEPTLLCEDFRFRVCPPPDLPPACRGFRGDDDDTDTFRGDLVERMMCCLDDLLEGLPEPPDVSDNIGASAVTSQADDWYRWLCRVKQHLLDFIARHGTTNCEAIADLQRLAILRRSDFSSDEAYVAYLREALERMTVIFIELMLNCLCSALLPPCPSPATSTLVPLAAVTVSYSEGSCRVISICNWTRLRKYASSLQNLEYWTSFLPFGRDFRRLLECLCCDLLGQLFEDDRQPDSDANVQPGNAEFPLSGISPEASASVQPSESAVFAMSAGDTTGLRANLRERLNRRLRPDAVGGEFDRLVRTARSVSRDRGPVEPLDVFRDMFTKSDKAATGPFGSAGRTAPAEALLMNSLALPMLTGIAASPAFRNFAIGGTNVAMPQGKASDDAEAKAEAGEVEKMRAEIDELRKRLDGLEQPASKPRRTRGTSKKGSTRKS